MKKVVLTIVLCIIFIGAIVFFITNHSISNNTNNTVLDNIIVINKKYEDNYFIFNKIEVNQNTHIIKLYFERKNNDYKPRIISLRIFDSNTILEEINVNVDDDKGAVEISYQNDLSNAIEYSVNILAGNAST